MAKKKAFLVNVRNNELSILNEEFGLQRYYDLLGCDYIDIVSRTIGGKRFEIVCDDEGLLKDEIIVSAVDEDGEPMLVGNLLIFKGVDEEGELTSCESDDYYTVEKNLETMDGHIVLANVGY